MKRLFTLAMSALFFYSSVAFGVDYTTPSQSNMTTNQIQWETNFDKALRSAKELNKPILVLFTGTDWCTWCIRLEDEIFSNSNFADQMKDKFIYVKIDFPMKTKLAPDLVAQNKALKTKYKVEGFPSVIILNQKGEKIGSTGYRSGGPVKYGQMLLEMSGQN